MRDTTPPTSPLQLSATSSNGAASLLWSASSDAGSGVAGYEVWRRTLPLLAWTKATTTSRTSSFDTAVLRGSSYQYVVRAYDRAGNYSGFSPGATVTIT